MTEPLQIRIFNDKVRAMTQANARVLTLNAEEARNLHAEIYNLLALAVENLKSDSTQEEVVVKMDGGRF
jgi:enoyl-CoA hydratase/carnithine racemase